MLFADKKQIISIFMLFFIFTCAQNVHAMRCHIKSLLTHKASRFFCNKLEQSDDLKKLQQIHDSLELIKPSCFAVITKGSVCTQEGSCCLLAKNDAAQAKKGKAIRLKKMLTDDGSVCVHILRDTQLRMLLLQEKNEQAQKIVAASQEKEVIEPLHEDFRTLIVNISECLTYSANIYGKTFYEHSADCFEKHPHGIFNLTRHMTPTDREREKLQDECNEINKEIMKSNGYPLNKNILLGWGAHTCSDLASALALSKAIDRAHRGHDQGKRGFWDIS